LTILSWVTAYHSFSGEVEASNTPTIRRLTSSRRHQLPRIALGRWLKMTDTDFGLLVFGELHGDSTLPSPFPGLSVSLIDAKGLSFPSGKLVRIANIKEIALVAEPAHRMAKVLGLIP